MTLTIRWKLTLSIIVPLMIGVSVDLMISYRSLRRSSIEQMKRFIMLAADLHAARLDAHFQRLALAADSNARMMESGHGADEAAVFALLTAALGDEPHSFGACIAFEPGVAVDEPLALYAWRGEGGVSSKRLPDSYGYAGPKWEWYDTPRRTRRSLWTEPYFDEGGADIVMCTYAVPFYRDGVFAGVATVDVRAEDLQGAAPGPLIDGYDGFVIVSRTGAIVSSDNPQAIMSMRLKDIVDECPSLEPASRRMLAGESGVVLVDDYTFTGRPTFIAFTPIAATGWSYAAAILESRVMAPVYAEMRSRGLVAVAVIAVAVGGVLLLSMRISRRVERLAGSVAALSAGDMSVRAVGGEVGDEIGALARDFNRMTERLSAQIEEIRVQTAARQSVESELEVARRIQLSLLPQTFPPFPERPEFDLHALNAPARHVAGDFFDFFFIGPDDLLVVIADVSGKGVAASLLMAVTRTIIRNVAMTGVGPARILADANRLLAEDNRSGLFVTVLLAIYSVRTGELRYANAGHPPAMFLAPGGSPRSGCATTGPPLGIDASMVYEEGSARLERGETVFWYTDGVTEARRPGGEMYGDAELVRLLAGLAGLGPGALCVEVARVVGEYQDGFLADDLTVLALRRGG